jgi:hypothetical protein
LFCGPTINAVEIINDDGYYQASDDIEVYKIIDDNFFDVNTQEFHNDALSGDMVLAYTNKTIITSLTLTDYNNSDDCVRELLRIESTNNERNLITHMTIREYIELISSRNTTIQTELDINVKSSIWSTSAPTSTPPTSTPPTNELIIHLQDYKLK